MRMHLYVAEYSNLLKLSLGFKYCFVYDVFGFDALNVCLFVSLGVYACFLKLYVCGFVSLGGAIFYFTRIFNETRQ